MLNPDNSFKPQPFSSILNNFNQTPCLKVFPQPLFDTNQTSQSLSFCPQSKQGFDNLSGRGVYQPSLPNLNFDSPILFDHKSARFEERFPFHMSYHSNMHSIDADEVLSLILFFGPANKPIGDFKFTITRKSSQLHHHSINFNLDNIFISNTRQQNKFDYLHLTGAVVSLLITFMQGLVLSGHHADRFTLNINKKFKSSSGKKIGHLTYQELNSAMNALILEYPHQAQCFVSLNAKLR